MREDSILHHNFSDDGEKRMIKRSRMNCAIQCIREYDGDLNNLTDDRTYIKLLVLILRRKIGHSVRELHYLGNSIRDKEFIRCIESNGTALSLKT